VLGLAAELRYDEGVVIITDHFAIAGGRQEAWMDTLKWIAKMDTQDETSLSLTTAPWQSLRASGTLRWERSCATTLSSLAR